MRQCNQAIHGRPFIEIERTASDWLSVSDGFAHCYSYLGLTPAATVFPVTIKSKLEYYSSVCSYTTLEYATCKNIKILQIFFVSFA